MDYPDSRFSSLVKRVRLHELPPGHRRWTGNDASQRNHNGRVPANEDPVFLELNWKRSKGEAARLVGGFVVNLNRLVRAGYLAMDPSGDVRLKFFHDIDGFVYLGRGASKKKIAIGRA